jgi:nucleoside-diphosphate-sugar epimerase
MSAARRSRAVVTIVGASGQVGLATRGRLARERVQARPLGRADDLASAVKDADVVVHLAGTLLPRRPSTYQAANRDTVAATCAALADSSARRVIWPGAGVWSGCSVPAPSAMPGWRLRTWPRSWPG